jgi:acetyl-CoA carboxylase biotin carboxylase subunit
MERLGSKTAARQLAARAGVPMVPGTKDPIENLSEAEKIAREFGYPVLLKAVAGGGGKGMRLVSADLEMAGAWRDAASEAQNAFGDARLYLEKYVERPRHIEIQIFGDAHGRIVHLGERECSVQRRHQKVIEESPSPIMTPELRRAMGEAAVRLARDAGYTNAGTVEFLVDAQRNFYFLEVNTRLQVEHPVTEMVTGFDLVKLQIRIAAGEPLPFSQQEVKLSGHAVECRLYAEDPDNHFFPSPGTILSRRAPSGPGIRLDDGVYEGFTVSTEYDPMLGKLISRGEDRAEAISRLTRALEEHSVTGIKTNSGLLLSILRDPEFVRGEIYTRWLDERLPDFLAGKKAQELDVVAEDAAILAALLHFLEATKQAAPANGNAAEAESRWKREARLEQVDRSE